MEIKKSSNKAKIIGGLFWAFGEQITSQLVSTLVSIVLARILDPAHYGSIALVTVMIALCNVFVTSGFGSALVQKKDVDDYDYNTAFLLSIAMSTILYAILFVTAPFISDFYKIPELTLIVRVMALRLPISSVNTIQQAHVRREMKFRNFFIRTLFGTVISGFTGIILAVNGFGVWALVAQYLTSTIISTIVLLIIDDWQPKLQFSLTRAKQIYSFGWKVLATELTFSFDAQLRSLIIGKQFGTSDLAYYNQGQQYSMLLVNNIDTSINKVMLPAYSKNQGNLQRLKQMLRRSIRISAYVLVPILLGFALVSSEFVKIVLKTKWLPCVPYIVIFCISYLARPLQTACHQALLAIGRSGIVLIIMILIQSFSIGTLLIAVFVFKNPFVIAFGVLLSEMVGLICFIVATSKLLNYRIREQLYDILPSLGVAFLMSIVVYFIGKINLPLMLLFVIKILAGMLAYLAFSIFFKLESYEYLKSMIMSKFYKKSNSEIC